MKLSLIDRIKRKLNHNLEHPKKIAGEIASFMFNNQKFEIHRMDISYGRDPRQISFHIKPIDSFEIIGYLELKRGELVSDKKINEENYLLLEKAINHIKANFEFISDEITLAIKERTEKLITYY